MDKKNSLHRSITRYVNVAVLSVLSVVHADEIPDQYFYRGFAYHIMVSDPAKAKAIRQDIVRLPKARQLAAFQAAARKYSEDVGSVREGGSLGDIHSGMFDAGFERAMYSLAVGEVSAPVRSPYAWHLILLTRKSREATGPFCKAEFQKHLKEVTDPGLRSVLRDIHEKGVGNESSLQKLLGKQWISLDWLSGEPNSYLLFSSRQGALLDLVIHYEHRPLQYEGLSQPLSCAASEDQYFKLNCEDRTVGNTGAVSYALPASKGRVIYKSRFGDEFKFQPIRADSIFAELQSQLCPPSADAQSSAQPLAPLE